MVNAVTTLSMVREELFNMIAETEKSLEQYLEYREERQPLQRATELLQQLSGTLRLLELGGAELLVEEILLLVEQTYAQSDRNLGEYLYAINRGLYIVERYLECVEQDRYRAPEALLPEINQLRRLLQRAPLSEGDFYYGSARGMRTAAAKSLDTKNPDMMARRLRQMYQIGLVGYLRETADANLTLMHKALVRLDRLYSQQLNSNFLWVAAAALEACEDAELMASYERKHLLSRIDRQIKQIHSSKDIQAETGLIKDLLYVIALAKTNGRYAQAVREDYQVVDFPYQEADLQTMREALKGPGLRVYSSLAGVLNEELANAKDELDLMERGTADATVPARLLARLDSLQKTFETVGMTVAVERVKLSTRLVNEWIEAPKTAGLMDKIAGTLLDVEAAVKDLERGYSQTQPAEHDVFYIQQLAEAKIVVNDEARIALAMAQRAVMGYLEADGDKLYLAAVPVALKGASGGLGFLEQHQLAGFIDVCDNFISQRMIEPESKPNAEELQALAGALTGVEYMLERGIEALTQDGSSVLTQTEQSVATLKESL